MSRRAIIAADDVRHLTDDELAAFVAVLPAETASKLDAALLVKRGINVATARVALERLAGPSDAGEYIAPSLVKLTMALNRNVAGALLSALVGRLYVENDRDEAVTTILLAESLKAIVADLRDQERRS